MISFPVSFDKTLKHLSSSAICAALQQQFPMGINKVYINQQEIGSFLFPVLFLMLLYIY